MSSCSRRLPVYLVLDCSESMAGGAIEAVARGVQTLLVELRKNPLALETAFLSAITFSRDARQVVPLTELMGFQLPKLSVRTGTAMGGALRLLTECIQREVVKTSSTQKGDYRPLVFLFTDGQPTDEWESVADQVKTGTKPRIANVYAIGCGPDVDTDILQRITEIVLLMTDISNEAWQKVFVWLSASVDTTSRALEAGREGEPVDLPALPADVLTVAPESSGPKDPRPRQVFLHARCTKTGKPYLMRFARGAYDDRYAAIASHPLEELDEGEGEALPPINTELLDGCPSCPYCENPVAAMCECGSLMCTSGRPDEIVTCPHCHMQVGQTPGGPRAFDIKRVEG